MSNTAPTSSPAWTSGGFRFSFSVVRDGTVGLPTERLDRIEREVHDRLAGATSIGVASEATTTDEARSLMVTHFHRSMRWGNLDPAWAGAGLLVVEAL